MSEHDPSETEKSGGERSGGAAATLTVEEFAERYDDWADEYDDENDCEEIRACASLVVEHASPGPDDVVVDLGTGTGSVALTLAEDAGTVVGRDVSEGTLDRAREKATERGIENVTFGTGRFRAPNVDAADVVVSNFAMHHLGDGAKREAIETVAGLDPRKIVLGEGMDFGERDPEEPFFSPKTVYPSTVGHMVDALTDAGFAVTALARVHDEIGVVVAEKHAQYLGA